MKKIYGVMMTLALVLTLVGCSTKGSEIDTSYDTIKGSFMNALEDGHCSEEAWEEYDYLRGIVDETFKHFYDGSRTMTVYNVSRAVEDIDYVISNFIPTTDLGWAYRNDVGYLTTRIAYAIKDLPSNKELLYVSRELTEAFDLYQELKREYPILKLKDLYVVEEVEHEVWDLKERPYIDDSLITDAKSEAEQMIAYSAAIISIYQLNEYNCIHAILVDNDYETATKYLNYLDEFYQAPNRYSYCMDNDIDEIYEYTFTWMFWELEALHRMYEYGFEGGSYEAYEMADAEADGYDFSAVRYGLINKVCERYGIVREYNNYLNVELVNYYINQ